MRRKVAKRPKVQHSGSKTASGAHPFESQAAANDDWLGATNGEEALSGLGSDDDADVDEGGDKGLEENEDDEEPEYDKTAAAVLGGAEDGGAADDGAHRSRILARIVSGDQSADLGTVKQKIQDDAALLAKWSRARQLGDKRTRKQVLAGLVANCSTYYGYSEELAEYFLQMFSPEQAIQFFEANERPRPLTVRTNSLKTRRSSLIQSLTARKVQVDPVGDWTKVGLKIYDSAVPIGATPEYLGGQYMIQSASSFVPVMALAPQQHESVLDMAAAPGGKTTYIGQLMQNTGTLFANDLRKERCKALVANVHRLGLTNVVATNLDGRKLGAMMPKMDRVLLDAPCTGSGIIARDPAVKVKRGTKDFEEQSRLQKELLATAIDIVDADSKTGGYIVYSTCSVSVEENEAVIEHALLTRSVKLVPFSTAVNFGVEGFTKFRERRFSPSMATCRRYYPHTHNMDGFFVAKLKKFSNDVPERPKKDRFKGKDHVTNWGAEHWTPEMFETVVDFTNEPDVTSQPQRRGEAPAPRKKLNKVERKRIKRQGQLAAKRAGEATAALLSANAAVVKAAASESVGQRREVAEPEEEPKPKTFVNKIRTRPLERDGTPDTKGTSRETVGPAAPPGAKTKRKKAMFPEPAEPAEPTDLAEPAARPATKKKRRKA